jgi:hypothetical protein
MQGSDNLHFFQTPGPQSKYFEMSASTESADSSLKDSSRDPILLNLSNISSFCSGHRNSNISDIHFDAGTSNATHYKVMNDLHRIKGCKRFTYLS